MRIHLPLSVRRLACVFALALVTACGQQSGGDARRLIPADTQAAVVVESVETLRAKAAAFLAGIKGTSGVLELIEGRYGIALSSAEALAKSGVDPATPLVMFRVAGATVIAAGVNDDERFLALVDKQLTQRAGGATVAEGFPRRVTGPNDASGRPRWQAAYGVTNAHVGVLVVADTPETDAVGIFTQVEGRNSEAFVASADAMAARELAGKDGVAWFAVQDQTLEAPEGLGIARGVLNRAVRGLEDWQGGVGLAGDRLQIHVASTVTPAEAGAEAATLPVEWLGTDPEGSIFADVFPKTTPLLVRGRFATSKIRRLPSFLLDRVLPRRIPGTAGLPLPPLPEILEFVGEDFAVALLGFDDRATVQSLARLTRRRGRVYDELHVALAATVRDEPRALEAFAEVGAGLAGAGWTVAQVTEGPYRGMTFVKDQTTFSVLIGKGVVVFLTGAGEVGPFLDTAAGRALSLRAHAEGEPTAQRALGLTTPDTTAVGLTTSLTRLTRELAEKGVPPYFLMIINDIRIATVAVGATATRVTFDLELAQ